MILAWCHPLIIVFDCENSFHNHPELSGVFSVWLSGGHHLRMIIYSSFQLSFSKSYRCIVQVYSSQLMISLFSCIQVPLKYLYSFSNSSRWIVHLLRSFSILTVVRSRFLFLHYHIILFVVSILPMVRWRPSQVCAISILILSKRISSMPNLLLVINLNWWRISIM